MNNNIFSALVLTSISTAVIAQEPVEQLSDMVVTATRDSQDKHTLSTATTVYTRGDIDRLQVHTFPELLRGSLGVDMVQSGGYGRIASVFMRGTNSSHVLVLIDGIKVGSATAGISPFELLPLDQIERVEITRGPQSSLYGSEAIGGVIQIFTRKGGKSEKLSVTLDAGGGSFDTYRTSGTLSGKWQNSWYNLSASSIGSEGFSAQQGADTDRDGYQNTALNARVGHRFANNAEIEAFFLRAQGTNEYDNKWASDDNTQFIEQVVGASASMDILSNWRTTLRFGQSRDDQDYLQGNGALVNRLDTTRWNGSWMNQLTINEQYQLLVGGDYRVDEIDTTTVYSENSRYDAGIFGELHSQPLHNHFINASVRWDKNEAFGEYVTGNVGWRYNSPYGISPFASFGNAFKAPTFTDLYAPVWWGSNLYLQPEQSKSFEIGLAGQHDWGQWELRGYHTNIDNLIAGTVNADGVWQLDNINKAQIDGIESEISTQLLGWQTKLSLNLLSPRDRETNQRLLRRADKTLAFDVSRHFVALDVGATVLAQNDRFDFNEMGERIKLAGLVTVDLRSSYQLTKNWQISAKLSNLLDEDYQTVNSYNMAGRNFFVSIHYNN